MSRFYTALALPHVGILLGVLLSAIAWLLPPFSSAGKGFVAATPSTSAVVRTLLAYGLIATMAAAGYAIGQILSRRLPKPETHTPLDLRSDRIWTAFILFASIGVASAFVTVVQSMGLAGCIRTLAAFNANAFKATIYADYNVGFLSLRYVAVLAAAIAIFRYLAFRQIGFRSIISIFLLMMVALISSRLSVIWAVVAGGVAYLLCPDELGKRRITRSEILAWTSVFVLVLGGLTISRTYGYYQEQGAESLVAAVGSEFQRYLAAPFQGSIEAVNDPQYRDRLNDISGIDGGLTTNSALMEFAVIVGRWNLVALSTVIFFSGLACGLLRRYSGTYLVLAYGVLHGCHVEIWRLAMFSRGITITLLFFAIVIPLMLSMLRFPGLSTARIRIRLR